MDWLHGSPRRPAAVISGLTAALILLLGGAAALNSRGHATNPDRVSTISPPTTLAPPTTLGLPTSLVPPTTAATTTAAPTTTTAPPTAAGAAAGPGGLGAGTGAAAPESTVPTSTTSTTAVPADPCRAADVAAAAATDEETYAPGTPVVITFTLTDHGTQACTLARSPGWATLTVTPAATTTAVWSATLASGSPITLEPGAPYLAETAVWAQYSCTSPCADAGPAVPPGDYAAAGTAAAIDAPVPSAAATFSITGSVPPTTVP